MSTTVRSFRLDELATLLGAELRGDPACVVGGLATLDDAVSGQLSFFANPRYLDSLRNTQASAVLVAQEHADNAPCSALVMSNPYLGYATVSQYFERRGAFNAGIAHGVQIDPSAKVSESAQLCANVVVGAESVIGKDVYLGPNTVVGARCQIDEGVRINANVTLYDDIKVGAHSLIHSGAVIGADGFGFAPDNGKWVKISQLGGVSIGENVEVGAGTTIDRGALADTVIADGVKLDNQIQIAHNVIIGEDSAIAGCTAVAGSTKIGARCTVAGGAGITGHLDIADGTHITAMSLVTKSVTKAGAYSSGTGLMPHKQWKRSVVRFRQLDELAKRLKSLEEKLDRSKG
ncbi:UDP-3-O-(3-hydroxymyristoyl)glucosamine N-acyltransferase [Pontibacterium granulatum]|uniref:UDP-3-O-(3-hydroxymyristoyl)glucosamine N-acyltransferase n=1 Tax=Pontibacterium granulatum TaxID=2036029 RepID=UPI00249B5EB1|nr:UDP-3-O-(3-hydroxymyristoyl)glucosamine N-acyltransferase [Pontibacterium granulatum]MDI3322957.1 UDP-3-O-(3-hydroxymyristoyl)glucosamine N-acyltransferase [Pontibacterium granulatum]